MREREDKVGKRWGPFARLLLVLVLLPLFLALPRPGVPCFSKENEAREGRSRCESGGSQF